MGPEIQGVDVVAQDLDVHLHRPLDVGLGAADVRVGALKAVEAPAQAVVVGQAKLLGAHRALIGHPIRGAHGAAVLGHGQGLRQGLHQVGLEGVGPVPEGLHVGPDVRRRAGVVPLFEQRPPVGVEELVAQVIAEVGALHRAEVVAGHRQAAIVVSLSGPLDLVENVVIEQARGPVAGGGLVRIGGAAAELLAADQLLLHQRHGEARHAVVPIHLRAELDAPRVLHRQAAEIAQAVRAAASIKAEAVAAEATAEARAAEARAAEATAEAGAAEAAAEVVTEATPHEGVVHDRALPAGHAGQPRQLLRGHRAAVLRQGQGRHRGPVPRHRVLIVQPPHLLLEPPRLLKLLVAVERAQRGGHVLVVRPALHRPRIVGDLAAGPELVRRRGLAGLADQVEGVLGHAGLIGELDLPRAHLTVAVPEHPAGDALRAEGEISHRLRGVPRGEHPLLPAVEVVVGLIHELIAGRAAGPIDVPEERALLIDELAVVEGEEPAAAAHGGPLTPELVVLTARPGGAVIGL